MLFSQLVSSSLFDLTLKGSVNQSLSVIKVFFHFNMDQRVVRERELLVETKVTTLLLLLPAGAWREKMNPPFQTRPRKFMRRLSGRGHLHRAAPRHATPRHATPPLPRRREFLKIAEAPPNDSLTHRDLHTETVNSIVTLSTQKRAPTELGVSVPK